MKIRSMQGLIVITSILTPHIQKADPDPINGDNPQDTWGEIAFFEASNFINKVAHYLLIRNFMKLLTLLPMQHLKNR